MQRRLNTGLLPEFQTADDGDYYAVLIEQRGQRYYAFLPRFDLTLAEANHGPGGMGRVFYCPGYDPQLQYHQVKVVRPAIFEPDGDQSWRIIENGELDLGPGE